MDRGRQDLLEIAAILCLSQSTTDGYIASATRSSAPIPHSGGGGRRRRGIIH